MEIIIAALILGGIVLLILLIKFIKFLFTSFLVSRLLSFVASITGFILAFFVDYGTEGITIASVVLAALSWLFFIGPAVCEVEWDGTFWFDFETGHITPGQTLGLIGNAIVSAIIFFFIYAFGSAMLFKVVFYLVPMALFLLNIGTIIWFNRR